MRRKIASTSLVLVVCLALSAHGQSDSRYQTLLDEGGRLYEAGDYRQALERFAAAEKLAPKKIEPLIYKGTVLQKLGQTDSAIAVFSEVLKRDPKQSEVRAERASLLLEKKAYGQAISELEIAVREKSDLSTAWYNLGQAYMAIGRCDRGLAAYRKMTERFPSDVDGWINLSVAERKCNKLAESLVSAKQAARIAPKVVAAQLNLALVQFNLDDRSTARQTLRIAIELDGQSATAWWTLGQLELKDNHPDEAIVALERAVALKPTASRLLDLVRAYGRKKRFAEARDRLSPILEKEPESLAAKLVDLELRVLEFGCQAKDREELKRLQASAKEKIDTSAVQAKCK